MQEKLEKYKEYFDSTSLGRCVHCYVHALLARRNKPGIFAFAGTIVILWQMLLPGYVLTLDMVFANNWLIQKLLLFGIFFLLFYLPIKFFPFEIDHKFKYWAGLFYAINPFVYERFLAGHWLILLLYALLPPIIYYLIKLFQNFKKYCIYFIFWFFTAVFVFSFYFAHFTQVLKIDNPEYWQVFKTSSFLIGGSSAKVIMLYGFWGESYPWANYFIWPTISLILQVFVILTGLIILGIRKAWFQNKKLTILLLIAGFFSFVFALGISEGPFKNFNLWLFENISFWRVFRDTTKWLAPMAYIYAVFGALGVSNLLSLFRPHLNPPLLKGRRELIKRDEGFVLSPFIRGRLRGGRNVFVAALFLLPLIYTYPMLGGFARQIQPVWYPESWVEANNILKQDKECKALFLPWHLYYSLSFNNNLITANPASRFFDCEIIFSQNIEMGEIKQTAWPNWQDPAQKIKYIIYTTDLEGADIYDYSFLKSENLKIELSTDDLVLFKVNDRI